MTKLCPTPRKLPLATDIVLRLLNSNWTFYVFIHKQFSYLDMKAQKS